MSKETTIYKVECAMSDGDKIKELQEENRRVVKMYESALARAENRIGLLIKTIATLNDSHTTLMNLYDNQLTVDIEAADE